MLAVSDFKWTDGSHLINRGSSNIAKSLTQSSLEHKTLNYFKPNLGLVWHDTNVSKFNQIQ